MAEQRRLAPDDVAALARLIFNFRLVVLVVTIVYIPHGGGDPLPLTIAWLLSAAASYVPLRYWGRLGPVVMRHPAYLAADLLVSTAILAVTGVQSPFFYLTLGTALLSGVLYSWAGAGVFSGLLLAGYWGALVLQRSATGMPDSFQLLVGNPALYPVAAAAGAAVRGIIEHRVLAERALRSHARVAAIERERSRIAREMHDSLAKTLEGISLSAHALARWVERDPERARGEADELAAATRRAAQETRGLLIDLRSDAVEAPLPEALRRHAQAWSERTGIEVACALSESDAPPAARWEAFCILREALANVEHHAHAEKVRVELTDVDHRLILEVSDDGRGFAVPVEPSRLTATGHFGVVGIRERAAVIGGSAEVISEPGRGTTVRASLPLETEDES